MHDLKPSRLELALLCAILFVHGFALLSYFVPTVGLTDSNLYHMCARMVERHDRFYQMPVDEYSFIGRMWVVNERGEHYPKYPPFYSLLAGVVSKAFGDPAGLLLNPISLLLSVLGTWVLCRAFLPGWAAVLAAWLLSTSPLLNTQCLQQGAHATSTLCVTWGYALFFFATRAHWRGDGTGPARPCPGVLMASGLLLGYACGIRNPDVLLVVPPALWLFWHRENAGFFRMTVWSIGVAIPILGLMAFHWSVYGHPLRTGYAFVGEQTAFTLEAMLKHARFYIPSLISVALGWPLTLAAVAGFVILLRQSWRKALFVVLWMGPFMLLYMVYYWAPRQHPLSFLRFLCPMTVPFVVLAVVAVRELVARLVDSASKQRIAIAAFVLVHGAWAVPQSIEQMELRVGFNDLQHRKVAAIREHVPKDSVVFAELWVCDALDYWQEYPIRVDELLDQDKLRRAIGTFESGKDGLQPVRVAHWKEKLGDVDAQTFRRNIGALISDDLKTRGVYVAGSQKTIDAFAETFAATFKVEQVAAAPKDEDRFSPRQNLWNPQRGVPTIRNPSWDRMVIVRVQQR